MSKWLWQKTGGRCAYCGVVFATLREMTVDHIVPRAAGGSDARGNRMPCCRSCNATKGSRPLDYLRESLQRAVYGRPRFTTEQSAWLAQNGFVPPPEERYQFYFESLGLEISDA